MHEDGMRRFFIERSDIDGKDVIVKGKEAHHIRNVIRLKKGDRFLGFDNSGKAYTLCIEKITEDVYAKIEKISSKGISSIKILLASALPKKSKMDDIIQKATELGVHEIIPITTENTIVKIDAKAKAAKKDRWDRIALEASKQCARDTLPKIHKVMDFKRAVSFADEIGYKKKILPCLCEGAREIESFNLNQTKNIAVFIGPEGDFSEKEIDYAKNNGLDLVSLGPLVLRVDTACFFSISALRIIEKVK